MNRWSICRLALAVAVSLSSAQVHAAKQYAVQLAAFGTAEEAESARQQMVETLGDVRVHFIEGGHAPHKVVIGQWETYADAWAAKSALPEGTQSFIVSWEVQEGAEVPVATLASETSTTLRVLPFDTTGLEATLDSAGIVEVSEATAPSGSVAANEQAMRDRPTAELLAKQPSQMTREELLSVGMNAPRNSDGVPALQRFLEAHSNDPRRSAVDLRLSRRLMGRKDFEGARAALADAETHGSADERAQAKLLGAYVTLYDRTSAEAYEAFRAVASDSTLPADTRRDAMRMAAGSAHAAGKYTEALAAYRQIEEIAPDPAGRTEATMQRAGLALELATRGKGNYEDVRTLCERVANTQGASRQTVATAKLMHLESRFHEGDAQGALAEIDPFLAEFPDVRREHVSATVWKGVCLVKLGRASEAESILRAVTEMNLEKSDKFSGHEPQAKAAVWLTWIARQRDDAAQVLHWKSYIAENFPESKEVQQINADHGTE